MKNRDSESRLFFSKRFAVKLGRESDIAWAGGRDAKVLEEIIHLAVEAQEADRETENKMKKINKRHIRKNERFFFRNWWCQLLPFCFCYILSRNRKTHTTSTYCLKGGECILFGNTWMLCILQFLITAFSKARRKG